VQDREFSIEDLFPDDFYLERVKKVYGRQLAAAGETDLELVGNDQLCKRVERALEEFEIKFNKGSVAKVIRSDLCKMKSADELPEQTKQMAHKLFERILEVLPTEEIP